MLLLGFPQMEFSKFLRIFFTGKASKFRKSGILVEFSNLSFRVVAPGNLGEDEMDEVLEFLYNKTWDQMRKELYQLEKVYQALLR